MRLEVLFAFARDDDPLADGETPSEREVAFVEELLAEHGFEPDRSKLDDQLLQSHTVPSGEAVEEVRAGVVDRYGEEHVRHSVYSGGEFGVSPDVSVASIAIETLPDELRPD